jgi:EAL domain-containing protein (putative c-di-GMP-specific phosphodiesterase class I)
MLLALHEPFEYDSHIRDTRATAGASLFPTDGATAADLLKTADIALYSGKNSRRGTLSLFHQSMRASLQKRASMLNVASIVVRDGRIVPHYQPKVSLADRKITGFEALLRWRHNALGIQQPSTIAAAFEDMNLAVAMSDAMLERIARDMRGWLDEGHSPGKIAINLSPAEFRHEDLVTRVLKPFERERVPLDLLELEITETVLLGRDTEKIAATLRRFRSEGMTIALDDFGTGYASLTHLKAFPVDVIKIDRSFIANVCERSDDRAIVDAIIGLAQKLGLTVVAEGIESEGQARYLSARRCGSGQGFLFGRAMSSEAVRDLLAAAENCHPPR